MFIAKTSGSWVANKLETVWLIEARLALLNTELLVTGREAVVGLVHYTDGQLMIQLMQGARKILDIPLQRTRMNDFIDTALFWVSDPNKPWAERTDKIDAEVKTVGLMIYTSFTMAVKDMMEAEQNVIQKQEN